MTPIDDKWTRVWDKLETLLVMVTQLDQRMIRIEQSYKRTSGLDDSKAKNILIKLLLLAIVTLSGAQGVQYLTKILESGVTP